MIQKSTCVLALFVLISMLSACGDGNTDALGGTTDKGCSDHSGTDIDSKLVITDAVENSFVLTFHAEAVAYKGYADGYAHCGRREVSREPAPKSETNNPLFVCRINATGTQVEKWVNPSGGPISLTVAEGEKIVMMFYMTVPKAQVSQSLSHALLTPKSTEWTWTNEPSCATQVKEKYAPYN